MKIIFRNVVFAILLISAITIGCRKQKDDPVVYENGTFPDTIMNILSVNSQYDDYNLDIYQITGNAPVIFSSNRKSAGGQFDLEQANIGFIFNKTTGHFELTGEMTNNTFLERLIGKATTPGNDFGPYRFYSSLDGYEYLVVSSVNQHGDLDLAYLRNRPVNGAALPPIDDRKNISLLNTTYDDAYFCLDYEQDTAYLSSNRSGNFDIYLNRKPAGMEISTWFIQGFTESQKADSINSDYDDKCPQVLKKIMVFTSNRPGGFGGYDLYYSIFRKGKWNSPVNLGPEVNSPYDEYRPVIGFNPDFTNNFIMFSSNRPEGKGGFDLYFTGVEFPKKNKR
jgi:hypothetical protein